MSDDPGQRIFSDEELRVAGLRSVDALAEALAADDRGQSLHFARRLRREILSMIGNYDGWEQSLLAEIRRLGGESACREVLLEIENPALPARDPGDDPSARWREVAGEIAAEIEAGHDERALELARNLHAEALTLHDRGMSRVTALLSCIGRRYGDEAIADALGVAMSAGMLGDTSYRERAEMLMHFTRVHLQPFELQEDHEKLTFLCPVCPSGGRLLREGHYDAPGSGLTVRGPQPLTYGRTELPVYCCHEPVMEKASIEASGVPLFIVDPSARLGEEPCKTYLYKDPDHIPERFYTRLGLAKPRGRS